MFGWLAGTIALAIAFHWAPACIESSTHLDVGWARSVYLLMVAWDALIIAVFACLVSFATSRRESFVWFAPAYWVAMEYSWPRLFPWAIAHSQSDVVSALQVAEYAGTSGVSSLVVLAATGLAMLILAIGGQVHWREPIIGLTFVVAALVWGQYRSREVETEVSACRHLRIAAVQVDPTYVGAVDKMRELSLAISDPVDLIVWPETSLGHYHESLDTFADPLETSLWSESPNPASDPSDGFNVPLLAGGKTYADGGRDGGPYRNTAFLIDVDKSIVGRYVKRTLMPIGEYVPGEAWWPQARQWAAVELPLVQGTSAAPLSMSSPNGDTAKLGVLICFEDMSRENARSTVLSGAQCLIALVNGSEFEHVDALVQHQRLAMLRSVENRRALLRCASTGITCFVSPTGRIVSTLSPQQDDAMVVSIPLVDRQTLYTRFGEWYSWLCIAMTILSIGSARCIALLICMPQRRGQASKVLQ